jgi:hypothetical protein
MTEQQRTKIIEMLRETRNPFDIQESTGAALSDIRRIMREGLPHLPGWGRLELQPYLVSRRSVSMAHGWPTRHLVRLQEMRRAHDQGRVTMCQGRSGTWILQYAIPTQKSCFRQAYFYGSSL